MMVVVSRTGTTGAVSPTAMQHDLQTHRRDEVAGVDGRQHWYLGR
jgi:hypothetical protein